MLLRLLSYPRGLFLSLFFFVWTLLCATAVTLTAQVKPSWADFIARHFWSRVPLALANINVEVRGLELVPLEQGYLVLFNHTSWMDILLLMGWLPRVPRFGAKIELFKIPFFGRAMRKMGMLQIERNNRKKVLQIYKDAELRAAAGECFALAPEGTRQNSLEIGRFKQGPFLFAVGAQIPIVPVLIAGARETMPRTSLLINSGAWSRKVVVQILAPVSTKDLSEKDLAQLQEKTKNAMAQTYLLLNKELGLIPG